MNSWSKISSPYLTGSDILPNVLNLLLWTSTKSTSEWIQPACKSGGNCLNILSCKRLLAAQVSNNAWNAISWIRSEIRGGDPFLKAVIWATCRVFNGCEGPLPTDPKFQLVSRRFPGSGWNPANSVCYFCLGNWKQNDRCRDMYNRSAGFQLLMFVSVTDDKHLGCGRVDRNTCKI